MRAAIMKAPFEMEVGNWETPRPEPGEVLVSVGAAGICAGDMYFYLGKNPYAIYPQICGHEIAGLVTGMGEGVPIGDADALADAIIKIYTTPGNYAGDPPAVERQFSPYANAAAYEDLYQELLDELK